MIKIRENNKKKNIFPVSIYLIIFSLFIMLLLQIWGGSSDVYAEDFQASEWARNDVIKAREWGIVLKDGDFREAISREEFTDAALRFLLYQSDMQQPALSGIYNYYIQKNYKQNSLKQFTDVRQDSAANIAGTLGIVNGDGNGKFRPQDPITRQEAAVLLSNIYDFYDGDRPTDYSPESEENEDVLGRLSDEYSDADKFGIWAAADVERMTRWDVMHGMGDGSFHPQEVYTREQCCAVFIRLYENAPSSRKNGNVRSLLTNEEYKKYLETMDISDLGNCVVGLLSDGKQGSRVVLYDTETWNYRDLLDLPDVTPDNYAAVTPNGRYVAYTTWEDTYNCRYLNIFDMQTQKTTGYFTDLPAKSQIMKISWMPDNQTLLFVYSDESLGIYQEIRSLNVTNGRERTLVKGETWRVRILSEEASEEGFYLKGEECYQPVQEIRTEVIENKLTGEKNEIEWAYYLTQKDIDRIYQEYGGKETFDISLVPSMMYVQFSAPRCSPDGSKMIYSAALNRNSAPGEQTPLWMTSAIWQYDFKTGKSEIVYAQPDEVCIGRVDWVQDGKGLAFVSWYEVQGSQDDINYYNMRTNEASVIFRHTEENYNNVTLLPADSKKVTFTSSARYESLQDSETYQYDLKTGDVQMIDVRYAGEKAVLEQFIYVKMKGEHK